MSALELVECERSIPGSSGRKIHLDVTEPASGSKGLVIFCHGFKGFKDWGHFNLVAKHFADRGLTFIKFNFSYNGTTAEQPSEFADLQAFANNNYSKELDDCGVVMDWAKAEYPKLKSKIYLIGHSRGGGIAALKAAEDTRVDKLITWAAVDGFGNRFPEDLERYKREGVVYVPNSRTNQNMPLYYQFVEDYFDNEERLNLPERMSEIRQPTLIIHGSDDEGVSVDNAIRLNKGIKNSTLQIIMNTGHTFGVKHPFEGDKLPEAAERVVNLSIDFLLGDR